LLAEAAELATALGDRFGAANVLNMRNKVALDAKDWANALSTSVLVAEEMLEIGQKSGFGAVFVGGAFSFRGLGEFVPAAVLMGYARTRAGFGLSDLDVHTWDEADAEIDAALGPSRAEELRTRRAALNAAEAAAH